MTESQKRYHGRYHVRGATPSDRQGVDVAPVKKTCHLYNGALVEPGNEQTVTEIQLLDVQQIAVSAGPFAAVEVRLQL